MKIKNLSPGRAGYMSILLLGMATSACSSTGTSSLRPTDSAIDPGIDSTRAFLKLSEIEPIPTQPARPESLKPLSKRSSRQIEKAQALISEQRYTEAAIELERALRYDPNHPEIHRALALLHWQAGNLERARSHIAKSLKGNPHDTQAHYIAGRCEALNGNSEAALTSYRTALLCSDSKKSDRAIALCHFHLGETLAGEGYLAAALREYDTFETLTKENPPAHDAEAGPVLEEPEIHAAARAKATIYEMLGRFGKAADSLAALVETADDDTAVAMQRARLLLRADRKDEALAAVREIRSNDDDVIELLAEIHRELGDAAGIITELRSRIAAAPRETTLTLSLVRQLADLERLDQALEELKRLIDSSDGVSEAQVELVRIHLLRTDYRQALAAAADGLVRYPDHADIFAALITKLATNKPACDSLITVDTDTDSPAMIYLRGVLAEEAKQTNRALVLLQQAHRKDASFTLARIALGRNLVRAYRYDEASAVVARKQEDQPETVELELILGQISLRLDKRDEAQLHFRAAAQMDRSAVEPVLALARLFRRTGRALTAQRQLRVLLERHRDHEEARELLAFAYLDDGKLDVALEQFEELKRRATSPHVKARAAGLLGQVESQNPDRYREDLLAAIEEYGDDASTWMAIAESYSPDRNAQAMHDAYAKALSLSPDDIDAATGVVGTSERLLNFDEAINRLETLLRMYPNRHTWRYGRFSKRRGLIELYWVIQDFDTAIAVARKAQSRSDLDDSWRRRYRVALIETLRRADQSDEAHSVVKQWVAEAGDDLFWSVELAGDYLRRDEPSRAVAIFQKAHDQNPTSPTYLDLLVDALVEAKDADRAGQLLLTRLDDDPQDDIVLMKLANVLAASDALDDGLELIRGRLLQTHQREQFQNLMIDRMLRAKRYAPCAKLIEAVIDEILPLLHDPQNRVDSSTVPDERRIFLPDEPWNTNALVERVKIMRTALAQTLIQMKSYRQAEERINEWLEGTPDPAARFSLLRLLTFCYQTKGDTKQAETAMERALRLKPMDIGFNNDLAYGWIDRGEKLEDAERMIRFAVAQDPLRGAFLDTYGWLHYKKGDFALAKTWLTRARRSGRDDDSVVRDHLGDACWKLGETPEAIEHWQRALEIVGEFSENEFRSDDERRVQSSVKAKVEDARAGRKPSVADVPEDRPKTPSEQDG